MALLRVNSKTVGRIKKAFSLLRGPCSISWSLHSRLSKMEQEIMTNILHLNIRGLPQHQQSGVGGHMRGKGQKDKDNCKEDNNPKGS